MLQSSKNAKHWAALSGPSPRRHCSPVGCSPGATTLISIVVDLFARAHAHVSNSDRFLSEELHTGIQSSRPRTETDSKLTSDKTRRSAKSSFFGNYTATWNAGKKTTTDTELTKKEI